MGWTEFPKRAPALSVLFRAHLSFPFVPHSLALQSCGWVGVEFHVCRRPSVTVVLSTVNPQYSFFLYSQIAYSRRFILIPKSTLLAFSQSLENTSKAARCTCPWLQSTGRQATLQVLVLSHTVNKGPFCGLFRVNVFCIFVLCDGDFAVENGHECTPKVLSSVTETGRL